MPDTTAKTMLRDWDWLVARYYDDEMSLSDIGKLCGVTAKNVHCWFVKLQIPCRDKFGKDTIRLKTKKMIGRQASAETRRKIGALNQRGDHWNWRGGISYSQGYRKVRADGHPYADRDGYVPEHRLVAEKALGKYLHPRHPVHHINGKRDDNRPTNLVICEDNQYHQLLHRRAKKLGR